MTGKIVTLGQLCKNVEDLRGKGKLVAATSGCFDLLHAGHVAYLEQARAMADALVVMLNSDSSVRSLKGAGRPIVGEAGRAAVLAGLAAVDYVCIFSEGTPCLSYESFRPDIVIKGGDYRGFHIAEMDTLAAYGGRVEFVDFMEGFSSTGIVEKIKRLAGEDAL